MVVGLRLMVLLAFCSLWCGCGPGKPVEPAKFPVTGTVLLNDKPLPQGVVYFKTVATGAFESFDVKDGKFAGKAEQGERRVEICVYEQVPAKPDDPMSQATQRNTIPARYNTESELTAKVDPSGPNEFTFKMTSD